MVFRGLAQKCPGGRKDRRILGSVSGKWGARTSSVLLAMVGLFVSGLNLRRSGYSEMAQPTVGEDGVQLRPRVSFNTANGRTFTVDSFAKPEFERNYRAWWLGVLRTILTGLEADGVHRVWDAQPNFMFPSAKRIGTRKGAGGLSHETTRGAASIMTVQKCQKK